MTISPYIKNILTVLKGTAIAQLLPIITSPIISRLFTPEQFGVYYVFSATVSILLIVFTLRYDQAIVLPERDDDAANVLSLSLIITSCCSFILLLLMILFFNELKFWLDDNSVASWFFLLPFSLLLNGWFLAFYNWCIRKKYFETVSTGKISESVSNNSVKLIAGFFSTGTAGLILSTIVSQATMLMVVMKKSFSDIESQLRNISVQKIISQAKTFREFPLFLLLGNLFNVAAFMLPNMILAITFGNETAGYFGFTQRIFQLPLAAISLAVGEVFRQQSVAEFRDKGNCIQLFTSTIKSLTVIALFPFLILLFFAKPIFIFCFGAQWETAGTIAQIFSVPYFIMFISTPFISIFQTTKSSKPFLLLQLLMLLLVLATFVFAGKEKGDYQIFYFLSTSYLFSFILILYFSFQKAKGN